MERTIVGIDVGTTKICTLVGLMADDGILRVGGVGVVPAEGVRRGVVTDVMLATRAIGESVRKAQRGSGVTVTEAYVGVGGSHIASQNNPGAIAIGKGDRPIDRDDLERVMEVAQAVAIPHNRRIIHAVPRSFTIDGQNGVKNPLGLMGFRLEVDAHIVTGATAAIQNLVRCVEASNIRVLDLVLQPLASAGAVLTDEEQQMGVTLVDIGGGTTDIAVYLEGGIWETLVRPTGGEQLTHDIAVGLHTPHHVAEAAKIRYAHANPKSVGEREMIELATFGEEGSSSVPRRFLCEVAAARAQEILETVERDLRLSGLDSWLPAGAVITGGTAALPGLRELAVQVLQMPVRIGMPRRLHGVAEAISSPAYATSVGLLLWGQRVEAVPVQEELPPPVHTWQERLKEILRRLSPRG